MVSRQRDIPLPDSRARILVTMLIRRGFLCSLATALIFPCHVLTKALPSACLCAEANAFAPDRVQSRIYICFGTSALN